MTNIASNENLINNFNKTKINITFLGGSVTAGYCKGEIIENSYPNLLLKKLNSSFENKEFKNYNFGLSGTSSLIGLFYFEIYIKENFPDLIFLEYSINETGDHIGATNFESLIRKINVFSPKTQIIIITLMTKEGHSAEEYMLEIANHHSIPLISIPIFLKKAIKKNMITWDEYSYDNGHPNEKGHDLIADRILDYIKITLDSTILLQPKIEYPCFSFDLYNLKLLHSFNNFVFNKNEQNLSFKICCKKIFIMFEVNNDLSYGKINIEIDKSNKMILDSYSIFGWKNPIAKQIFNDNIIQNHNVNINLSNDNKNKTFTILSIGYV